MAFCLELSLYVYITVDVLAIFIGWKHCTNCYWYLLFMPVYDSVSSLRIKTHEQPKKTKTEEDEKQPFTKSIPLTLKDKMNINGLEEKNKQKRGWFVNAFH